MASIIVASLVAGILTVLAPCIVAALPLILGRGADGIAKARRVITGLLVSVFVFTFALKVSTAFLGVPASVWQVLSGSIIILVGISMLWPLMYARVANRIGLERLATRSQQQAMRQEGWARDYLVGASLGPVFSACSPTYGLIVAVILPTDIFRGTIYLLVFLTGLGIALTAIAIGGSNLVAKLGWSLDPQGAFKRTVGGLFIAIGLLIALGLDKEILGWLVERGWYDWQLDLEDNLR
jgi:cytochrome c biogenesis protein CcdA